MSPKCAEPEKLQSDTAWCCPRCRGALQRRSETLVCDSCESSYPVIAGIPDRRAFEVDWLDYRDDRAEAQRFATADAGGVSPPRMIAAPPERVRAGDPSVSGC